jgi:O-6-methylguanine DNA methyltransferase
MGALYSSVLRTYKSKTSEKKELIYLTDIETPLGKMTAGCTNEGICLLEFTDRKEYQKEIVQIEKHFNSSAKFAKHKLHKEVIKQLEEYFSGKRKTFGLAINVPGTEFQKKVWNALIDVPYGKTRTYLEQSKTLGNPKAIRAIAKANGNNRISIIIPCHRIIGTNGNLIGYGGGLWRKKWLLQHEQNYSGSKQESLF